MLRSSEAGWPRLGAFVPEDFTEDEHYGDARIEQPATTRRGLPAQ
jgi:hypothetical protein